MKLHRFVKPAAALLGVLLLGSALGYWIAHRGMPSASEPVAKTGERKVLYWYDPMVPSARFDKPGKSPFMDMQLVPVYADEQDESGVVRVSPDAVQNLGIRLGTVETTVLPQQLDAVGSIAFDERLLELVQARVDGYVTRLYVKSALERVRRGQRLAEVQAPQWIEAQQEYLALLDAQSQRAQSIRDAARQRLAVLGVPEATIRAIESTRRTQPTTTLFAPLDGVVTELAVREGSAFSAGAALFRLNGLKTVWVNAQIPEAQVSMIAVGSSVIARATAWPGANFEGKVIALLPDIDRETRTLTARVELQNDGDKLAPGMYVSLHVAGSAGEAQLFVPSEAVIMTGERSVVIVAREGGGFEVADVRVGTEMDGRTTILSGLKEGQSVVVSGQFLIDSEASLKSSVGRLEASEVKPGTAKHSSHRTQGRIVLITADQITIAHEPVPSLDWPAMTMAFKAPGKDVTGGLEEGDRVSFSFSESPEGGYQIERIAPQSKEPPP